MTRQFIRAGAMALIMLAATACGTHWGNFKKISMQSPADKTAVGERVSGSDCTLGGWHTQNIANAARDALKKAPGAVGLKDVVIQAQSYQYLILNCIAVEGTPVK